MRSHAQKFFMNIEKTKKMDIDEYIAFIQKDRPPDQSVATEICTQKQEPKEQKQDSGRPKVANPE